MKHGEFSDSQRSWFLIQRTPFFATNQLQMLSYGELNMTRSLNSARNKRYDVVPLRVNMCDSLQKILKYIAQNLQHGSIF